MGTKVQDLTNPKKDFSSAKDEVEAKILFTVRTYLDDAKENLHQRGLQLIQNGTPPPCLCAVLSPLIRICSFFGLFPVSLDKGNCVMSYNWISKPGMVNVLWLTFIFVTSFTVYSRAMDFFHTHVANGTDFYTFGLLSLIQLIASAVIFLCGNFKASKFVETWNAFHQVVNSVEMEGFTKLKGRIYIIPAYLLLDILLNVLTTFWGLFTNPPIETWIVVMMPFSGFLVTFIPGLFTCSYVVILWIIGEHFKTITQRVGEMVGDNSIPTSFESLKRKETARGGGGGVGGGNELAEKVMKLRLQHEKLAGVVRHLEDAFGIQILAIFVATSFGFVSGVYGLIIYSHGLTAFGQLDRMMAAYSLQNVYGGVRILIILVSSQFLMNAARAPANTLNGTEGKDFEVQIQVDKFLSKLGNFPVQVNCCDMFRIGNCFLAAASSNVVTYVLVLMQFRLDACTSQSSILPVSSLSNYSSSVFAPQT